ncbi:MAG: energy transducer TonB [Flavobacteriaceae bacterium]
MKTKKQTIKLQKSSGLFMQLGLVLTLAIVYAFFEHKTEIENFIPQKAVVSASEYIVYTPYEVIEIEREVVKHKALPKPTSFVEYKKSEESNKEEKETPIILDPDDTKTPVLHDSPTFVTVEPEEEKLEFIATVPEVPIYPGCEKGTRAQKKACFEKKVGKFISKKFNTDIASQMGLPSGKQRIHVQFVITKSGDIEIIGARANHKRLEKEGKRVVNLLPKMTPGKKNGKPVNVSYMVPISFNVQ